MTEQPEFLPPEEFTQVVEALRFLDGRCDGAVELDGVGFSKIDTDYGKDMAALGYSMTQGQAIAANKMLWNYIKQLRASGYDLPEMQTFEKVIKKHKPKPKDQVILHNQRIHVYFSKIPSEGLRQAMKCIKGWHWEDRLDGKPWSFPAREAVNVISLFMATHEISKEVSDFEAYCKRQEQPEEEPPPDVVTLKAHEGSILVYYPYAGKPPDDELDKVRDLPSREWKKELPGSPWSVPFLYYPNLLKAFPDCFVDQSVRDLNDELNKLAVMGRAEETDFKVKGLKTVKGEPRPYQYAAMEFIIARDGTALIADDQGLGKCLESIGYLQYKPELRPIVIISPASVKTVWKREVRDWLDTKDAVEVLQSRKPYQTWGSILVINYEILSYWADHIRNVIKPALVIADECHYFKSPNSQRTKAGFKVILGKERKRKTDRWSHTSEPVAHFLALTGTPITNAPLDIWPILHLLDPKAFKSRFDFAKQFGIAYEDYWGWQYDGWKHLSKTDLEYYTEKLNQAIAPYTLRRRKQDVLTELPDKIHIPLPLDIDPKTKVEYYKEVLRVQKEIRALKAQGQPAQAKHLGLIEKSKQIVARGKTKMLISWITDVLENEKLIAFATHTETIDTLMKAFDGQAVEISGRIPVGPRRDKNIDAFMNDPNVRLCCSNIKAGGLGLTLTAASKALFVEFPWNPGDLVQATDRIHRMGQDQQVMVYYACAADTIDEMIVQLLTQKAHFIDRVMDGEATDDLSIIQEVVDEFMKHAEQIEMELR